MLTEEVFKAAEEKNTSTFEYLYKEDETAPAFNTTRAEAIEYLKSLDSDNKDEFIVITNKKNGDKQEVQSFARIDGELMETLFMMLRAHIEGENIQHRKPNNVWYRAKLIALELLIKTDLGRLGEFMLITSHLEKNEQVEKKGGAMRKLLIGMFVHEDPLLKNIKASIEKLTNEQPPDKAKQH